MSAFKINRIDIVRYRCDMLCNKVGYILNYSMYQAIFWTKLQHTELNNRSVASLTVPGGQEFHFPHFFLKFGSSFLTFPQTFLIFFLILTLRVGKLPTREGPGFATAEQ